MNPEDKLEWLRYLSQIHRSQFDERRKYEWKAFLTLLTFYVLCAASKLSGKVPIPHSAVVTYFFFGVFVLVAYVAMLYLADLHTANNDNKEIAENAEHAIMDILGGKSPKISRDALLPTEDESLPPEKKRQIFLKDLYKFQSRKRGVWGWRWQVIMICIFAITVGVIFMLPAKPFSANPRTSTSQTDKSVVSTAAIPGERTASNSAGAVTILIPVMVAAIAFCGGLVTWRLNERSKRIHEEYKRKEEKYSGLIRSLRGFYVNSENRELKTEFLNQLNLCWMYCPDEVIRKAYNFLNMVHTGQKHSDEENEKAVGELMLAIREDLIGKKLLRTTNLKPEDFKHLKAK